MINKESSKSSATNETPTIDLDLLNLPNNIDQSRSEITCPEISPSRQRYLKLKLNVSSIKNFQTREQDLDGSHTEGTKPTIQRNKKRIGTCLNPQSMPTSADYIMRNKGRTYKQISNINLALTLIINYIEKIDNQEIEDMNCKNYF